MKRVKRVKGKKIIIYGLLVLFLLAVAVPGAGAAEQDLPITFNGELYRADAYIEDGVTMISTAFLQKIPGIEVSEEGYVPLRQFFENLGGTVSWDDAKRSISLSWREEQDGYTANQLIVASQEKMKELNTYSLTGNSVMEIAVTGPDAGEIPPMPSFNVKQAGVFQQEPMAMHIKQVMEMPFDEMTLTEEELALFGDSDGMVTEMVWTNNAIYQKTPLVDQWIVQDLGELGLSQIMEQFTQMSPQQSLDMMAQYGMFYTFGDNQLIDGQEYYVVNSYIGSEVYKKLFSDLLGDDFLSQIMMGGLELTSSEQEEFDEQMAQAMTVIQTMLEGMEMDYRLQSLINKNNLTSDYTYYDMVMTLTMEDPTAGPVSFSIMANGDFAMSDYGLAIELPDLSGAITQQEYMELMFQEMAPPQIEESIEVTP